MKPILFSTPMVQAILDGRKTQTRRVIKPQPPSGAHFIDLSDEMTIINIDRNGFECPKDVDGLYATFEYDGYPECPVFKSPYSVGNVLWVRETWKPQDYFFVDDIMSCQIIFKAGGPDNLNPRVFWNHGDDTIFESC